MTFNRNQLIFFGLIAHLLAAFFSVGFYHCDEKFQIFEFAGYKLGLNQSQDLPWEFQFKMRSAIQPFIVFITTKTIWTFYHASPFLIACLIRLMQVFISFYACLELFKLFENEIKSEKTKRFALYFLVLGWFMPFLHVRFSSEVFSSALFLIGLTQLFKSFDSKNSVSKLILGGLLMGLAFVCRFQISFMIFGLIMWLIVVKKPNIKIYAFLFFGGFVALVIGALIDKWLYNQWTISWWNYLDLNFFQNRASQFGESPFYFYITESFLQLIPPFSVLIICALVGFWLKFKTHLITWITLPFIVLHFFVAHKELRFLFPIINFLPILFALFFEKLHETKKSNLFSKTLSSKKVVRAIFIINYLLLLFFILKPADDTTADMKTIYELTDNQPTLIIYEELDPYSATAELNYFKRENVKSIHLDSLSSDLIKNKVLFYYYENPIQSPLIIKNNMVFNKVYSKYPDWFKYLNFNGWLERSGKFSIYKKTSA